MKMITAGLLVVLSPAVALAQKEPLRPAPVPGLSTGTVAPADRAGRSDAVDNASPFSAAPSGQIAGSGQGTPQTLSSGVKDSAPTPSLSK